MGDGEVPSIVSAINRAAASPEMSRAALALARTEHRVEDTADLYAAALEQAVAKVAA